MHIAHVHCVEAGKIVDIYQARALFFDRMSSGTVSSSFAQTACRSTHATRVTVVNYDLFRGSSK